MPSNLPPGISESDLPGNRPEELYADEVIELLAESDTFGAFIMEAMSFELKPIEAAAVLHTAAYQWITKKRADEQRQRDEERGEEPEDLEVPW